MARPTRAEILLGALRANLSLVLSKVGDATIIPVVKADAYGHGAIEISKELIKQGISKLAVACLEEAVELRDAGIDAEIFILGPLRKGELAEIIERRFVVMLSGLQDFEALASCAGTAGKKKIGPGTISAVVYVDTGMGRMGFMPEQAAAIKEGLDANGAVKVVGIFSHFPCAESLSGEDLEYTGRQVQDFRLFSEALEKFLPGLKYLSMANSGAIICHEKAVMDAVRPGIMLYGVRPDPSVPRMEELKPVMRWVTEIDQVRSLPEGSSISYGRETVLERPSKIALIPVGYADGLNRRIGPGFELFVRGRPAKIVGRITMDLAMIDVTDVPGVKTGDRVLIMGRDRQSLGDDGSDVAVEVEVAAEDHARAAGTIPYEILTSVGNRVKKVYLDDEV